MSSIALNSNKPFDLIIDLLKRPCIKEKQPELTEDQCENLSLSMLIQMLTHSSFEQAQILLSEIGYIVYSVLKWISTNSNPITLINRILAQNMKDQGRNLFKTSRKTHDRTLDTIRPEIENEHLQRQGKQYVKI